MKDICPAATDHGVVTIARDEAFCVCATPVERIWSTGAEEGDGVG